MVAWLLVRDGYVDVFQRDDVAEVFGGSIESTLHGWSLRPRVRPAVRREPRRPRLQYLQPQALWVASASEPLEEGLGGLFGLQVPFCTI